MENNSSLRAQKKNMKPLLVTLSVVFLLLIGTLLGWKWYLQIQEYKNNINQRDQQIIAVQTEIDKIKENETISNTSESKEGYLDIKEWGVWLKSTESPMSYVITTKQNGDKIAWLTNAEAQGLIEYAECTIKKDDQVNHYYLASNTRYKTKPESVVGNMKYLGTKDGYYFYSDHGNGVCSDQAHINQEAEILRKLYDAANTLELK